MDVRRRFLSSVKNEIFAIYYTSSNGGVVTPYNTSAFGGAKIISNTYTPEEGGVIKFDREITEIGYQAFSGRSLTSVIIPDSVESIGYSAFYQCSGLTGELIIPDSVTSIGEWAFNQCGKLTGLTIGSGVTIIGDYAFYYCSGLTGELVIPDNVTSIGSNAFYQCSGLTSVTIGSGVTSIGYRAFY